MKSVTPTVAEIKEQDMVILHILKNICAKFQLAIIFGWVSLRIDRTIMWMGA